jgi:hypothetical protein
LADHSLSTLLPALRCGGGTSTLVRMDTVIIAIQTLSRPPVTNDVAEKLPVLGKVLGIALEGIYSAIFAVWALLRLVVKDVIRRELPVLGSPPLQVYG